VRVETFDYALPPELVAQVPAERRDAARLLVAGTREPSLDRTVADLAEHVAPGTLVVVNDTRVIPARILGVKEGSGGRAEIFLVRRLDDGSDEATQRWSALGRASKGLRPGTRIVKGPLVAEIEARQEDGLLATRLSTADGSPVDVARRAAGQMPLPPYIRRELSPADEERYQTVFASVEGAVAAPTAGLHMTEALLEQLRLERGCEIARCTLHVGLGTFQAVTVDDLDDHPMHAEHFTVSAELASAVASARARGAPVLAVGTTVVRALESAASPDHPDHVVPSSGETRILIQPGRPVRVVDRLLTNFHLPKSTLLALVCAFAGTERVLSLYAEAVARRYRFFSYGDAMLLDRGPQGAGWSS